MSKEVQRNILNLGGDAANVDSVAQFHFPRSSGTAFRPRCLPLGQKLF